VALPQGQFVTNRNPVRPTLRSPPSVHHQPTGVTFQFVTTEPLTNGAAHDGSDSAVVISSPEASVPIFSSNVDYSQQDAVPVMFSHEIVSQTPVDTQPAVQSQLKYDALFTSVLRKFLIIP
jgi:hypothetical protein